MRAAAATTVLSAGTVSNAFRGDVDSTVALLAMTASTTSAGELLRCDADDDRCGVATVSNVSVDVGDDAIASVLVDVADSSEWLRDSLCVVVWVPVVSCTNSARDERFNAGRCELWLRGEIRSVGDDIVARRAKRPRTAQKQFLFSTK
jgi:hypothetical protein